jgi:hypothetical protein
VFLTTGFLDVIYNFYIILSKILKKPAPIPRKSCILNHHFDPHLVHAHLEKMCYIAKEMAGWDHRMRDLLTERKS